MNKQTEEGRIFGKMARGRRRKAGMRKEKKGGREESFSFGSGKEE